MADDRRAQVPGNVSLKLRSRQQVARQLGELLAADDPRVVEVCHRALLAAGPDLLPMFGRSLDTADPRAVRRLGTLAAAYPDRAAVVGGLRAIARDPQNTDLKRMAAMVILEQFLDEELEPHFFSTLRDPAQVAMNSLVRVLEGAHRDRNLLLAYLSALEEQHPDALATVLDSLSRLPGDQSVEILKLLAQHQDADLAEQAQQLLVQQRTPEALFALRMLDLVMPPARREGLQRAIRKLGMTGAAFPPWAVPPPGTRALLTGIDGRGAAAVWFVVPRPAGPVQLLSLVLSDSAGVADAFGGDDFSPESFPSPAPVGTLHRGLESRTPPGDARPGRRPAGGPVPSSYPSLDVGGARALPEDVDDLLPYLTVDEAESDFLEVDFDYARMLVLSYHEFSWARENPLPWEYRLLHDLIWRFGAPPETALPAVPAPAHARAAGLLWEHPYFQGWYLDSAPVYGLADEILSAYDMPLLELPDDEDPPGTCPPAFAGLVRACSDSRLARCFPVQDRAVYAWRLARSAEWLACAGDADTAALARGAAGSLPGDAIAGNAFALTLLQRSIYRAAALLTEGHRPLTVH